MPLNNEQADRLFDSILAKLERRLGRAILQNFNKLARDIQSVIESGGELEGNILISQNIQDLESILITAYEQSIREGVRFTRRDLDLPEEDDDSMIEEALLLLLLWRQDTAAQHAQMLTNTTMKIFKDKWDEVTASGLIGDARARAVGREIRKRNRGRVSTIATSEAGEAISAGSLVVGEMINTPLLKAWTSQRNSKVRDSHRRADQRYTSEPIPLNENFQVGGSSGPYPRSSHLSIEERANCYCYLRLKRQEDVLK